jgi:replicative DNA helicase
VSFQIEEFERGVLGYFVKNPVILMTYGERFTENFFHYTPHKTLFSVLSKHIESFGRAPTRAEFEMVVKDNQSRQPQAILEKILEAAEMAWDADSSSITSEKIHEEFVRRERELLLEEMAKGTASQFLEDIPKYQARLEQASRNPTDVSDLGMSIFSKRTTLGGLEYATGLVDEMYTTNPVATGYKLIDEVLMGGLRSQEVTVILAFINVGKSLCALNMAINMAKSGKRVVYFALDNTKVEMADRSIACLTGVPITRTRVLEKYREDVIHSMGDNYNENFILVEWAPKRYKVSDIKTHLERLKRMYLEKVDIEDGRPNPGSVDVIIGDSGDLFLPDNTRPGSNAQQWERQANVYEDFVILAKDLDIPVLLTTQGTRLADNKVNLSLADVAEGIGKFRPVGNVIGLAQTMRERVLRTFRAQFLKLRRPEGVNHFVKFYFNPYLQKISEDPRQTRVKPMVKSDGKELDPNTSDVSDKGEIDISHLTGLVNGQSTMSTDGNICVPAESMAAALNPSRRGPVAPAASGGPLPSEVAATPEIGLKHPPPPSRRGSDANKLTTAPAPRTQPEITY